MSIVGSIATWCNRTLMEKVAAKMVQEANKTSKESYPAAFLKIGACMTKEMIVFI